jgi:hypothetical protein
LRRLSLTVLRPDPIAAPLLRLDRNLLRLTGWLL